MSEDYTVTVTAGTSNGVTEEDEIERMEIETFVVLVKQQEQRIATLEQQLAEVNQQCFGHAGEVEELHVTIATLEAERAALVTALKQMLAALVEMDNFNPNYKFVEAAIETGHAALAAARADPALEKKE